MGSAVSVTSPLTSNGWKTTEIADGKPVTTNNDWSIKKKKKKKKHQASAPIRRNDKLIKFYKNDRRFISVQNTENKQEDETNTNTTVRLMSYNILADGSTYALSHRHNYCSKQYRKWSYRFQSILCQLEAYEPDIVCIQETTPSSWKHKMQEPLKNLGYIGIHAARERHQARSAAHVQSDCVIWKKDKFILIKHKILRLNEFIKKPDKESEKAKEYDTNYDHLLGSERSMFRSFCSSCYDVVIVLHLICKQTNKQFIVCSSHFFWDPAQPEVKSTQAMIFNIELERLLTSDETWKWNDASADDSDDEQHTINKIPIIFGVDANSMPFKSKKDDFDRFLPEEGAKSGVYELMIDGVLHKQHKDHPYRRINEREKLFQKVWKNSEGAVKISKKEVQYVGELIDWQINIKWRSVYSLVNKYNQCKEPLFTNRTPQFTDTLDYIFISNSCRVKSFLEMPWKKTLKYHMLQEENDDKHSSDRWIANELKKEAQLAADFPYIPNTYHPSDHLPLCADITF